MEITSDVVEIWREKFYESPSTVLAQNICVANDPISACLTQPKSEPRSGVTIIDSEIKSCSRQTKTKCGWIYAGLHLIAQPFIREYNLTDDFEFSQAYLLYWHKLERSNFFLNTVVDVLLKGESVDGRLFSYLMKHAVPDGGQWQMLVNLIKKYGLIPKQNYVVSFSATNTKHLNTILNSKLRDYAYQLHEIHPKSSGDATINAQIEKMMAEIFKILTICMGDPPMSFTWEYYDKSKEFKSHGPMTSVQFYERHVMQHFNVADMICLGMDPRESRIYDRCYAPEYCNNVWGGKQHVFCNQPVERVIPVLIESLKAKVPVWCACDTQTTFSPKSGQLQLDSHNFELVYGIKLQMVLTKSERMFYRESQKNHIILLKSAVINEEDEPLKFSSVSAINPTENINAKNGNEYTLTTDWFKEFAYEVVVNKQFVSGDMLPSENSKDPEMIPIWDQMGAWIF